MRGRIPPRYAIRYYPDITHSIEAQRSVNDWDVAFAMTEEREVINPRPLDEAHIFRKLQRYANAGFITYSEGCNDDVNKFVWSSLGWNPDSDISTVLRDYGRYFIGPDMADGFAQGLLSLEQNWRGPLLTNSGVDATLDRFEDMERKATPQQKRRAMERLATARSIGAIPAMDAAEKELAVDPLNRSGIAYRMRVFELAEALFQSIHMQLSVPRYAAISPGRGANLDLIDQTITDAPWLVQHFAQIRSIATEAGRLAAIAQVLNWTLRKLAQAELFRTRPARALPGSLYPTRRIRPPKNAPGRQRKA